MIMNPSIEYSQTNFYKDVLDRKINYKGFVMERVADLIPDLNVQSYKNFYEHDKTKEIEDVLERRFPYFSHDNVIEMLRNKIVIDFERENSISEIRANKIIFKFIQKVQKNLNLFLDDENGEYFITSFFLENNQDMYKKAKDGTYMNTMDVLCLYIEDSMDYSPVDFQVNWKVVTKYVIDQYNISSIGKLKKYFSIEKITKSFLEGEKQKNKDKIDSLEKQITEKKEEVRELMTDNVDIADGDDKNEIKKALKISNKRLKEYKEDLKRAKKKAELINNSFGEIDRLNVLKMKSVYIPLLANSDIWEDEFWIYVLEKWDCFQNAINPQKIKSTYWRWKNDKDCKRFI